MTLSGISEDRLCRMKAGGWKEMQEVGGRRREWRQRPLGNTTSAARSPVSRLNRLHLHLPDFRGLLSSDATRTLESSSWNHSWVYVCNLWTDRDSPSRFLSVGCCRLIRRANASVSQTSNFFILTDKPSALVGADLRPAAMLAVDGLVCTINLILSI